MNRAYSQNLSHNLSAGESTLQYFEQDFLEGSELEGDASIYFVGATDLSTAAASEATSRYEGIEVARKRKTISRASQISLTPLTASDGPVLPVRSSLDGQINLSSKVPSKPGRYWMVEALTQGDDSTGKHDCNMRLAIIYKPAQASASHEGLHDIR